MLSPCKTFLFLFVKRKEKVKETVVTYTSKSEVDKILIEATSNENWNVPNSKLQVLADAAYSRYTHSYITINPNSEHYQKIVDHLLLKLEVPAFEWRRI